MARNSFLPIKIFNPANMSRLLRAVFANDGAKIISLLDSDPKRIEDRDALCQGIGWGRREAVKLLVQRGADLNAKDRNNNHPLNMACHSSALELFDELIGKGSDPTRADGLATDAAWAGRTDILRYLHQAGFDMNQSNARGIRPLAGAVGMGHLLVVKYLLSLNVDTSMINTSKPLVAWKGAMPGTGVMEEIRKLIIAKRTGPSGPANVSQSFRSQ